MHAPRHPCSTLTLHSATYMHAPVFFFTSLQALDQHVWLFLVDLGWGPVSSRKSQHYIGDQVNIFLGWIVVDCCLLSFHRLIQLGPVGNGGLPVLRIIWWRRRSREMIAKRLNYYMSREEIYSISSQRCQHSQRRSMLPRPPSRHISLLRATGDLRFLVSDICSTASENCGRVCPSTESFGTTLSVAQ